MIIPVYNVEAYIVQCLQSVADQTWKDGEIECIIVDDCGTDRSMELVEEFISSYSGRIDFKVVRHERNRGLSAARNTGMERSSGEYVCFIDSDDYLHPSYIDCMMTAFTPYIGIVNCCSYFERSGVLSPGPRSIEKSYTLSSTSFIEKLLFKEISTTVWGAIFRRDIIRDVRFREGLCNEDYLFKIDLSHNVEESGQAILFLEKKLYYYRQRENSICSSVENPFLVSQLNNFDDVLEYVGQNHPHLYLKMKEYILRVNLQYAISLKNRKHVHHKSYLFVVGKIRKISNSFAFSHLSLHLFGLFMCIKYAPRFYSLVRG